MNCFQIWSSVMSAAVIKRKMVGPLSSALSDHHCQAKKPRQESGGISPSVKKRVLCILKTLMHHIFALPFVKIETDLVINKLYLDDIYENVEKNVYGSIQEIMAEFNEVLDTTKNGDGNLNFSGRKLHYKSADIEEMAKYLKKEIEIFHEKEFSVYPDSTLPVASLSELIGKEESDEIIFNKLKSRYENVPEVMLLAKALELSVGFNVDVNSIEQELDRREYEEISKGSKPKYRSYKFFPCRNHDFDIDKVQHSYIAGYQFHKMITKATSAPIAMRTILNMSEAVESITYIENDESTKRYEEQRELFKKSGKVNDMGKVDEMLLFHGTAVASIENILESNFLVDALPKQVNTMNETRKKTMMFGRGVYFSEIPSISLMYGNGLVLCKVMLGDCEMFKPQGSAPEDIPAQYDSREVRSSENDGVIHVVKRPAQILPYCVIKLKNQSLSSQFTKPGQTRGQAGCPSFHCKTSPSPAPTASTGPVWSVVERREYSLGGRRRREVAEETVRKESKPSLTHDSEEVCSVCCDGLSSLGVVSLKCGHSFHSACLVGLVEHQTGQHHVQCPNCQAIHGVKTGNMPTTGKMMYTRHTGHSLPGYADDGMFIIKYVFNNGVQDETHPNPGKPFHAKGFPRSAFLPGNSKGERVLKMLITAFQRGLTFTIGRSLSRGEDDCVTWNGIHHKTVIKDNDSGHGYPDMDYLDRVIQELKMCGVTDNN